MRALVGSEGSTGSVPGARYAIFAKLRAARQCREVLAANHSLVNAAGQLDRLRCNRRCLRLHLNRLWCGNRGEADEDVSGGAYRNHNPGRNSREVPRRNGDLIPARREVSEQKLPALIRQDAANERRFRHPYFDCCFRDASPRRILNLPTQRSAGHLSQNRCSGEYRANKTGNPQPKHAPILFNTAHQVLTVYRNPFRAMGLHG